jgi:hypothetical protein
MRNAYKVLVENTEGREYLKDLGVDRRKILKWTLHIYRVWAGFIRLTAGSSGGLVNTVMKLKKNSSPCTHTSDWSIGIRIKFCRQTAHLLQRAGRQLSLLKRIYRFTLGIEEVERTDGRNT